MSTSQRGNQTWNVARARLPWLATCMLCSLASTLLLRAFEPVLERAIMLVPFISIITAMGGNVALQSATLVSHALLRPDQECPNTLGFLCRELKAAVILAIICASVCSVIAVAIIGRGNYALGLVVFLAMTTCITAAPVAGVCIPALLRRLGIDPAVAASPTIMAVSDLMGIAFYLAVAIPFLDQIGS